MNHHGEKSASCANGQCQATGECWPKTDREWARGHVVEEVESPPLVPLPLAVRLRDESGPPLPQMVAQRRAQLATPPAPRLLIAFTGLAGSGKSTAAAHLVKHRGFTRVRFAGPLKAMMAALGLTAREVDGDLKETPCELLGGKTPRWAMQSLGTEWGRDLISSDLWIRAWQAALANVPADVPVVVDDARFPNEAAAVTSAGGIVVRIERPGAGTASVHSSEVNALPAARTLHNTRDERNLREQVDVLLRDFSWADMHVQATA